MRTLVVAEPLRRSAEGVAATYGRCLVAAIDGRDPGDVELTLLTSRSPRGADPLARLGRPIVASALPARLLAAAWRSGRLRAPDGFDVVHAVDIEAPASDAPMIVTLHDVSWCAGGDPCAPPEGRAQALAAVRRAVQRGAVVVVASAEAADAVRSAAGPAAEVRVLEPLYGCDRLPPADGRAARALLGRLGVRGGYLLTVPGPAPLEPLVAAHARARAALPEPWPLVVAGPCSAARVPGATARSGVVVTGPVEPAVLAGLYAGARCVAHVPPAGSPGLPALDAMYAAVPLVSSALPGVGAGAFVVDPLDAAALAAALVAAAGDDRRRAELVTAGLLRAGEATWAAAAEQHVALWRQVAA